MKTKTLCLIGLALLINLWHCGAQLGGYNIFSDKPMVQDTIICENDIYFYDNVDEAIVYLYNSKNRSWKEDIMYADGSPLPHKLHLNCPETLVRNKDNYRIAENIVHNAFTIKQVETLLGQELYISIYVSPFSGNVTDVYFNFSPYSGYSKIPIEVFRTIELELKGSLAFEVTAFGKTLNYCAVFWSQLPKGRIEVTPTIPEATDDGSGGGGFTGNPIGNNTNIITSVGER